MRGLSGSILLVALAAVLAGNGCSNANSKEIQVAVTEKGFEPIHVTVKKGQPAVLVITRKTDRTCATDAIFAETGRKYQLPLNQPVRIDLTGVAPGSTVHYACGMDMIKGTVEIQAD